VLKLPMRAIFVSAPLPGHLDWGGYLSTAAAWQAAGHAALWVSGDAAAPLVDAAGVPFAAVAETGWRWPPPPPLPAPTAAEQRAAWQTARAARALDQWLDTARVAAAVDELTALAERYRPDLIVSEMFVAAAGIVAERLGIPFVVAGWPAQDSGASPADPLVAGARQRLEQLLGRWQLTGQNWTSVGSAGAALTPLAPDLLVRELVSRAGAAAAKCTCRRCTAQRPAAAA
jgi:hypothetical protein